METDTDFCNPTPQHNQHTLGYSRCDKQTTRHPDLFSTASPMSAQHALVGAWKDRPPKVP